MFAHTSVQCLTAIAQHHGIEIQPERVIHDFALDAAEPTTPVLLRMAEGLGLLASARAIAWDDFDQFDGVFPLLARFADGNSAIVAGRRPVSGGFELVVLDPLTNASDIRFVSREDFCARWLGEIVLIKRHWKATDEAQPFGLRWFVPEILKQRAAFRDIAVAAVLLNLLALALPLYAQLVIDKVLPHESFSTLYVLSAGIAMVLLFEAAFNYLRHYLLLTATNKIDMRLTRRAFAHLLTIPIEYFESTTAGVVVRHMQQLQSVRAFLTGQLFFTALDATALLVLIPLMLMYSGALTAVVLAISLLMALVVVVLIKPFQKRLAALYHAEAARQSMLVETVHGMRTVKSLAIEPKLRKTWDQRSADAIIMHWGVGRISITAQAATQFLERAMSVAIIAVGTLYVFRHELTVGSLIAFQMLSARVVGPLVQIVGLVHQYQETSLSIRMLGDIMNRAPERRAGGGIRPQLRGAIEFDAVSFRYPGADLAALEAIDLSIAPGQIVGIVGKSGSGKSTLTKLLQGMYAPQSGIVRLDGVDMREIDLAHLRRGMGVVLQENFIFRGSVKENIAIARPDATLDHVVGAAQTAGADEFIERLPQGYDTQLEENGANLSGGQRQRLAIARAILTQPSILILDEAASALDPDSEAIFMRNLARIAKGKTVILISHRLTTLTSVDKIFVLDRGRLIDAGTHGELIGRCALYAHLWRQQTSHL